MSALVGIQLKPSPSAVIYKAFKSGSAIDTSEIAKEVSLSAQEVKMWIQHLQTTALNGKCEPKKQLRQDGHMQRRCSIFVGCLKKCMRMKLSNLKTG